MPSNTTTPCIQWTETTPDGASRLRKARWYSDKSAPGPKRVMAVDDRLSADEAFRLASSGTALLWQGDYHNARQLLQAMARRMDSRASKRKAIHHDNPAEAFHQHRQSQAQRANTLGMLLIPLQQDYHIPLRRAPDVQAACEAAWGPYQTSHQTASHNQASSEDQTSHEEQTNCEAVLPGAVSLRALQGVTGAYEWYRQGVEVTALNGRIHPRYGVFSPVRGEYVALLAEAALPAALQQHSLAFDIGTGTGVLAAMLAKRGISKVIATDQDPRALACAADNLQRLQYTQQVQLLATDMFPDGQAALIVCNPPWIPARPSAPVEYAIYDPDSRMLRSFLAGLAAHLLPGGEGWLILSDIAEHLGLRDRAQLLDWIDTAGLQVMQRLDTRPQHPKSQDHDDPLHQARSRELTSLWKLALK
ncbi:class I SAM-dependent methyltransferase [Pseudomethylobacillus aquaticus]|uniref:Class I SAM-dependent methyltransferase n=1 Tax=Pseudomethylobacillus aquaticus TaxID=2676064 RepID=A0A3N0V374_9PROT|nr:class I SAM-dependent methyltransferase [Pseudomethylobacillus aquaticus]ROH87042.1 class I SAM-dependent methyltransferase [Pseudomethylobacillus aquaticus]